MANDFSETLIAKQKWKLWLWGCVLVVAGLGFLFPMKFAQIFAVDPIAINLAALSLTLAALVGASLSIRCPKCGLSLVWHGLSQEKIGEWLSWLLNVRVCPRCGFRGDQEHSVVKP